MRLLAWLGLVLLACGSSVRGPNLVDVREITPRHWEQGDRVRLTGTGFPEGRAARVVFRGELRRAGEPPIEDVTIEASAELSSPHTLDVLLTPELTAALTGRPEPRHTTFRGDVEVQFAPRTRAGMPVGGTLEGVVVDITPDRVSETALTALRSEGRRFAAFVGAKLQRAEHGLVVASVDPQSRAARAGLLPGDVLLELDDMVVRDSADLVPAPNVRMATLDVQRGADRLVLRVESAGFRYHSPEALTPAVLMLGLVLLPLGLFGSSLGRALAFLERRLAERLRRTSPPRTFGARRAHRASTLLAGLSEKLPASFLPYFGLVSASSLFTLLALGKTLLAAELDLVLILAGASAGLVVAAVASGGAGARWSLRAGVSRGVGAAVLSLPALLALLSAAVTHETLEIRKIVAAQGPFPWDFGLFQSPVALVAGCVAFAALVPTVTPRLANTSDASPGRKLLATAELSYKLVCAGVLAIAFLGGWSLPGSAESVAARSAGALVLLLKAWSLLGVAGLLRWALGDLDVAAMRRLGLLVLVLPSAVCVLLALAWQRLVRGPVVSPVAEEVRVILFGTVLAGAALLVHRALRSDKAEATDLGVQSWL